MSIAGNGSHALESEIEELGFEPGFLKEWHEEGAETAVDVQWDLTLNGEFGEERDIVDDSVGEVRSGPNEEDGVAVYEAGDGRDVDLVGRSFTCGQYSPSFCCLGSLRNFFESIHSFYSSLHPCHAIYTLQYSTYP